MIKIGWQEANNNRLTILPLLRLAIDRRRQKIGYANSFIYWFAKEGKRIYGKVISATHAQTHAQLRHVILKQPVRVCAAITS